MKVAYTYKKYVATAATLKETLDKYGVAIIPKVINASECETMVNGMWDTLEHITSKFTGSAKKIKKDDPESWRSFYELFPLHSMLVQHWQIGHAQFMYSDLRQNPKIVKIWKTLWGTDDLLVSFDGVSCHFPPETTGRGWLHNTGNWLHTDQSYTRNNFECVHTQI
jgi:hypothetical protein